MYSGLASSRSRIPFVAKFVYVVLRVDAMPDLGSEAVEFHNTALRLFGMSRVRMSEVMGSNLYQTQALGRWSVPDVLLIQFLHAHYSHIATSNLWKILSQIVNIV
jgi:hypothetical protein